MINLHISKPEYSRSITWTYYTHVMKMKSDNPNLTNNGPSAVCSRARWRRSAGPASIRSHMRRERSTQLPLFIHYTLRHNSRISLTLCCTATTDSSPPDVDIVLFLATAQYFGPWGHLDRAEENHDVNP